jgi:hypothetical protein
MGKGIEINEVILIAGSGRNVGKTTLACLIVEALSVERKVTAVKISKHVHSLTEKQRVIVDIPGLLIAEELDHDSTKDSSRYLQSGACRSLFIQAQEEQYSLLANWLKENLEGTVVCETGYLGNFLTPTKAFFVEGFENQKIIHWKFPFSKTTFNGKEFNPSVHQLLTDKNETR